MTLAIIASFLVALGALSVGAYVLLRLKLVHRAGAVDIERFYGLYDMPLAVLWEVRNHGDLHFEFSACGKGWQLDLKCEGRRRLFLCTRIYHLAEFAWQRLSQQRHFPFLWMHLLCLMMLCLLAAAKTLVWPNPDDVAALVGFDSITAEKLTAIKAAFERREEANIK